MENNWRDRSQRGFSNFRRVYDITMAILFLAMAASMFFMDYFKLNLVIAEDKAFRYFFGSICLLFGGFRLYRGVQQNNTI